MMRRLAVADATAIVEGSLFSGFRKLNVMIVPSRKLRAVSVSPSDWLIQNRRGGISAYTSSCSVSQRDTGQALQLPCVSLAQIGRRPPHFPSGWYERTFLRAQPCSPCLPGSRTIILEDGVPESVLLHEGDPMIGVLMVVEEDERCRRLHTPAYPPVRAK
eukprot:6043297-Prymnesium_polylepis.1